MKVALAPSKVYKNICQDHRAIMPGDYYVRGPRLYVQTHVTYNGSRRIVS